jgi:hypothetical protein
MFYIVAILTYICFFLTVYAEVSLCRHVYVYAPGHVTLYVFFYWGAGGGVGFACLYVPLCMYNSWGGYKKESAIAIFCDLRKAFDTVNHSILLRKLHKIGIRGVALEWFKNWS